MSSTDATIVFEPGSPVQTTVTQDTPNVFDTGVTVSTLAGLSTLTVGDGSSFVNVRVTLSDLTSTFTYAGFSDLVAGTPKSATITVTANNGTTATYKFNLTRASLPGGGAATNATASFAINGTQISDNGSTDVTGNTNEITITPAILASTLSNGTPLAGATYTVTIGSITSSLYTGQQTLPLSGLSNGANTITVLVTARNGTTTRTYTFTVNATIASSASSLDANNADTQGLTYSLDSPNAGEAIITNFSGDAEGVALVIPNQVILNDGNTYDVVGFDVQNNYWNVMGGKKYASITVSNDHPYLANEANGYLYQKINNEFNVIWAPYSITQVDIPNQIKNTNVTKIYQQTFNGHLSVTAVTIGSNVTQIANNAFMGCPITSITIPNTVSSIGNGAFAYCYQLTSATIPNTVTVLEGYIFYDCPLSSFDIPNTVTSIGDSAFGNSLLTEVTIPASVTYIDKSAFNGCSLLTNFEVDAANTMYAAAQDGIIYQKVDADNASVYMVFGTVTNVVIPATIVIGGGASIPVTSIPDSTFSNRSSLTAATIGSNVKSIGNDAFYNCSELTAVTIPDAVTSIGIGAFYYCSKLTAVIIPDAVTSISQYAFAVCSALTAVIIPDAVTSIGVEAFVGCSELTHVTIGSSVTTIGSSAFNGCSKLTAVTIGASVTTIGEYAFYTASLTAVTIPASVTYIGERAFSIATLTNVYFLGNNENASYGDPAASHDFFGYGQFVQDRNADLLVSSIAPDAVAHYVNGKSGWDVYSSDAPPAGFSDIQLFVPEGGSGGSLDANNADSQGVVYTLNSPAAGKATVSGKIESFTTTAVVIPSQVSSGGTTYDVVSIVGAFNGASSLLSVNIPSSVTSIGLSAFEGCGNLVTVIGAQGVLSLGTSAFNNCSSLASAPIGSATSIPSFAFAGCVSLLSVTIPDSVTAIDTMAFLSCGGITSLTLGASVATIGWSAFYGCNQLSRVIFRCPYDTTINGNGRATGYENLFYNARFQRSGTDSSTDPATFANIYYPEGVDGWDTITVSPATENGYSNFPFQVPPKMLKTYTADGIVTSDDTILITSTNASLNTVSGTVIMLAGSTLSIDTVEENAVVDTAAGSTVNITYANAAVVKTVADSVVSVARGNLAVTGRGRVTKIGTDALQITATDSTVDFDVTDGELQFDSTVTAIGNVETADGAKASVAPAAGATVSIANVTVGGALGSVATINNNGDGGVNITTATKEGRTLQVYGDSVSINNVISEGPNGDIYVGYNSGSVIESGNLTYTNGGDYSYNGPTHVYEGSTLTFENGGVALPNSDVTIDAGATLELYYASSGSIDSYTENSVKSLVLNGTLAINLNATLVAGTYTLLNYTSKSGTGSATISYSGAPNASSFNVTGNFTASAYTITVSAKPTYTIGGTVSGLAANTSAILNLMEGSTVVSDSTTVISSNGEFTFNGAGFYSGQIYQVIITTQPNGQTGVITNGSGTISTNITDVSIAFTDNSTPPAPTSNVCFPAKTPIMTNLGPVNIEDINPAVHTIRNKKIVAITKTVAHDKNLVRIAKHALGHLYPEKTTLISQNHKVFCQGQMVKAKHLVDEVKGVTFVPYNGQVLYNVLLEEHEKMQVNNLIVETLHPEHKVAKLYRFLKNVDAAHHGKFIAAFNKKDLEQRLHR